MISLVSGLPILQVGDRGICDYSTAWLESSVRRAAREAGHADWWFAEDIVKSLFLYLEERYDGSVITVNQLFEKLRLTIAALGFDEIAKRLRDQVPPCRISLPQIASEASESGFYEWRFFERLGSRLDEAAGMGAEHICASGLKRAVRQLCGAKRWCRTCDHLHREIVAFIEGKLSGHERLTFQIA